MKESIVIVIGAIVILVVALVLLTIFGQGMGPAGDFATRANLCRSTAATSCSLTDHLPPDWSKTKYKINNDGDITYSTCRDIIGISTCDELS
ncbi:MAG: hypothetical protein GXO64_03110 [Candidatus Micrarchaeota archaeon]|nr:hypothetical protein [Candidatus Micrarchaeota archaeon]